MLRWIAFVKELRGEKGAHKGRPYAGERMRAGHLPLQGAGGTLRRRGQLAEEGEEVAGDDEGLVGEVCPVAGVM